jgi:hypothetical protein
MNKRHNLEKVLLVLALFIGLLGLMQKPATVQQAQSGAPAMSVVADTDVPFHLVLPDGRPGMQPNVNWNA